MWACNRTLRSRPQTRQSIFRSRAGRCASRQCFPERSARRIRIDSSGHRSSPGRGRYLHQKRCSVPRLSRRSGRRWRSVPQHSHRRAAHHLPACLLPPQALFRSSHRFLLLPFQVPPKNKNSGKAERIYLTGIIIYIWGWGLIRALLHFQSNPMLHLRILFSSNFAWQNSCRIVAQFLRKRENLKLRT